MRNYILKRLLLIPVTLLGILTINFAIVQLAPGGPVEYVLAKYRGMNVDAKSQFTASADMNMESSAAKYQGAQGVPEELVKELEKQFGFDKPVHERFLKMAADYARFDFGRSYYKDKTVGQLIVERLPVSVSLGLWSTLIIYLIAIPLGIKKAVRDGSKFDVWSSFAVILGYPGFSVCGVFNRVFCRRNLSAMVSAAGTDFRQLGGTSLVQTDCRLFPAYHAAGAGHGYRRVCQPDHAD